MRSLSILTIIVQSHKFKEKSVFLKIYISDQAERDPSEVAFIKSLGFFALMFPKVSLLTLQK